MTNRDVQTAWKYHEGTKHSYWSVRSSTHFLDWANRPLPFKIYPAIEAIALPRDVPQTGVAALAAISEQVRAAGGGDGASSRAWMPGCITLIRRTCRYGSCARVTFAGIWRRRPRWSQQ